MRRWIAVAVQESDEASVHSPTVHDPFDGTGVGDGAGVVPDVVGVPVPGVPAGRAVIVLRMMTTSVGCACAPVEASAIAVRLAAMSMLCFMD